MSFHWPIGYSNLGRLVACPGSLKMGEPYKDAPDTEEQLEGRAADWVAQEFAEGREIVEGSKTPEGWGVDADMIHGGRMWAKHARTNGGGVYQMPIPCERIHPTLAGGTPDRYLFVENERTLYVSDYKYGWRLVEAFENWQLMGAAAGLIGALRLDDMRIKLSLTIVQPRPYHPEGPVRTWEIWAHEIRGLINVANMAAIDALSANPECKTNADCGDCPARHECGTLQKSVYAALDYSTSAERLTMDANGVGRELAYVDYAMELLQARQTGLSAQAEAMLRSGQSVPNYMMAPGQARLAWTKTPEEVAALGDAFGVNLRKPLAVITPTQAREVDAIVSELYSNRPPAALKLTRMTTTATRKLFGNNARKS